MVFLTYSKAYRHNERETDLSRETVSWQRHTFYFSAKEARLDFEIGAIGANMGIYLDHISIRHVEKMSHNSVTTHVSAHVVYIHQWGSIHAEWSFIEDFSLITEYNWAIGIYSYPWNTNLGESFIQRMLRFILLQIFHLFSRLHKGRNTDPEVYQCRN